MLKLISFLFLLSITCAAQTKEYKLADGTKLIVPDFNNMLLIDGAKPVEVQVAKGIAYQVIILEFKDTTSAKTIAIAPKDKPIVLKEFVNDHDTRLVYSASWQKYRDLVWTQKFYNKDVSVTYGGGANVDFTFTGRRIEVVAEKCDNHASFKIELFKGSQVLETKTINMYLGTGGTSTNQCPAGVVNTIYSSADLPTGSYSIRVTLVDKITTTVPARNSGVLDGFIVYE